MNKDSVPIYYEECNKITMSYYPFFLDKLTQVQNLSKKFCLKDLDQKNIIIKKIICSKCKIIDFYELGNIVWSDNIEHRIKSHQYYPSEYFIKVIINMYIINDTIVNPPIQLNPDQIKTFDYVPLHYNKLLIIDALMYQGSYPRYLVPIKKNQREKFIYSEHSGAISINNKTVDTIIVSAETDRVDIEDNNIFLPKNINFLSKYEYIFHTHPNTSKYGGRIKEGIIYEFPSVNDLFNFIKYHNEGKAQASIIISPEGIYVTRPIKYQKIYSIEFSLFDNIRKFVLKLEKIAIKKYKSIIPKISNPNFFHKNIGSDFTYIKMYNKFIQPNNLFIEFYPREKKNGEWCLRQINLPFIEK